MSVTVGVPPQVSGAEDCLQRYRGSSLEQEGWCNATFDSILCWPPVVADTHLLLSCPRNYRGVDPNKYAHRYCTAAATWSGRTPEETELGGWTNYSDCFIPEVKKLWNQLYGSSRDDAGEKLRIAFICRALEMVGLSVSFCCIIICLFLFWYFRNVEKCAFVTGVVHAGSKLRNNRTRIHLHLFSAILVFVVLRLTLYIDQYYTRASGADRLGIDNTPGLCVMFYVLQEWARSATFLWMFLEGYYLHSMLTRDVFNEKPNFILFSIIGWGMSMLLTAVWATVMHFCYWETECWWGFILSPYYWIIQAPRWMVIALNLGFLLNILRVLVTKLKISNSNDLEKIRKAARAALFLLPLLGIGHSLEMFEQSLDKSLAAFACYTIVLAVVNSFQGFFICFIYCFINQEVRLAVCKEWHDLRLQRKLRGRRQSHIDRKLSCRLLPTFRAENREARRDDKIEEL